MKTIIQETLEACLAEDENVALADGFEAAFIGIARQFGTPFAVYDRGRCITLLTDQGMSVEDAEEYMSFNTEGAWVGANTPAFMEYAPTDEEKRIEKFVTALIHLTKAAEIMQERGDLLEEFVTSLAYFLKQYTDRDDIKHVPGAKEAVNFANKVILTK